MSTVKSVNSKANSKSGLKGTINYVFAEHKTKQDLCYVTGDYMYLEVTPEKVFRSFMETKELFDKTTGRQCKHFVISWHEDSPIKPEEALDIAKEWAEHVFPEFSCAIAVHTDRAHCHAHVVVNSVSMIDGHKYHMNPSELQSAKDYCDELNIQRGFSIVEKGKHYDGSDIEMGTIRSYKKDAYKLLTDKSKNSNLVKIAAAILDVKSYATSKEEFIEKLSSEYGITVTWEDKRKYITFSDTATGTKARNKNLSETFTIELSKEALLDEFDRNKKLLGKLTKEKAGLESKCDLLEERISEVAGTKRDSAGTESTADRREPNIEAITRRIRETNDAAHEVSERGNRISRTFKGILEKLRYLLNGESVESLSWDAYKVAEELERYRIKLVGIEYNLRTLILPNLELKHFFRDQAQEEYKEMAETLYWYQYTLQNTDPATLILAQTKRAEIRRDLETESLKRCMDHNFDKDINVTELFTDCKTIADNMVADPNKAVDALVKEHGIEPYEPAPIVRGRHR